MMVMRQRAPSTIQQEMGLAVLAAVRSVPLCARLPQQLLQRLPCPRGGRRPAAVAVPAPACFGNLAEKSGASGAFRGLLFLQSRAAPVRIQGPCTIQFFYSYRRAKRGC